MTTVSRSGTLKRSSYTRLATGLQESARVCLPTLLVEIHSNKPTRVVLQQRIDANRLLPEQMISDNIIAQWKWLLETEWFLFAGLRESRLFPFSNARRQVSSSAAFPFPADRVHIVAPAKQTSK